MAEFSLDTPGSDGIGIEPIFLAPGTSGNDTGTDPGSDTGPRKRKPRSDAGQPRGGRGRPRKVKGSLSVGSISRLVIVATGSLAVMSKIPELKFDEDDAKSEAELIKDFADQFPEIEIDPRLEAAFNLIVGTATIAAAKIYLYKERMKAEKVINITNGVMNV